MIIKRLRLELFDLLDLFKRFDLFDTIDTIDKNNITTQTHTKAQTRVGATRSDW